MILHLSQIFLTLALTFIRIASFVRLYTYSADAQNTGPGASAG